MEKIALTMLSCYREIDFYIAGIETYITRSAVYSYTGANISRHKTTFEQATDIIKMIDKKNDLLALKDVIDKAYTKLTAPQKLLCQKVFFEKISKEDVMKQFSFTKRTMYRRVHGIIESVAKNLSVLDFEREWFEENCLSQSWIKNIHNNAKLIA